MHPIAEMTSSDEFSRLCKLLFTAEYPDFQTIDDSGGDGGNDGYSEAEKMLFQIYCPKKPSKANDSSYKKKVLDDLNKAKKLSESGLYEINNWVFVTPPELRENVQTFIRDEAKKRGFKGLAWSDPKLTQLLAKYSYLRRQFPTLIQPDIEQGIYEIKKQNELIFEAIQGITAESEANQDSPLADNLEYKPSEDQELLIASVNHIHRLSGNSIYDYRNDYFLAKKYIKEKGGNWFIFASRLIAKAIPNQRIEILLTYFENNYDQIVLKVVLDQLNASMKNLQGLGKNTLRVEIGGFLQKPFEFLGPSIKEGWGDNDIEPRKLELIFEKFESDLLALFKNFRLKKH